MSINSITVAGHLGTNPETVEGDRKTFGKARMAVSQGRDKPSIWFDILAWSQWAIADLMKAGKGDRVIVTGRLTMREWQEKPQLGISCDSIEIVQKQQPQGAPANPSDDDQIPW